MSEAQRHVYRSYGSLREERLQAVPSPSPETEGGRYPAALARKAYRALQIGFVVLAVVAGVDKFLNGLTDWSAYLAPVFPMSLGIGPGAFMLGVGALEIVLGLGLTLKPRLFADLFAAWLALIIVNLVVQGEHFDVALFNFALSAGACALARLSGSEEVFAFGTLQETGGAQSVR